MPTFELFKSSNCLHLKYSKVVSLGMSLSVSLSLSHESVKESLSFSLKKKSLCLKEITERQRERDPER